MRSSRVRRLVAFGKAAVSGATLSGSGRDARIRAYLRVPLPEGALVPHAAEENVQGAAAVRAALQRLAEGLGLLGQDVCVVLPDGLARPLLLELPRGVEPKEFARYRVLQTLPYPPAEALVETTRAGDDAVIATAVRRSVVQGYETAVHDAGMRQARIDIAPLAALEALRRDAPRAESALDIVLGDVSVLLAAHVGGRLRGMRTRLRDGAADEPARLLADATRTFAVAGGVGSPVARIVGPGARALVDGAFRGLGATLGWDETLADGVAASELAWIGAGA